MADPVITICIVAGAAVLLRRRSRRTVVRPQQVARQVEVPVRPLRVLPPTSSRREDLLKQYVTDDPTPGAFYQVQRDDTIHDVAKRALDTIGRHTSRMRLDYIHSMSSGPRWNMRLYGTGRVSKRFPKDYLVPVLGKGLSVAFLPRNDDALAALLEGFQPAMTVDSGTGEPDGRGNCYGLPWLPPVDRDAFRQGEITCAASAWSDGSSALDPDPELLAMLEAAA